MQLTQSYKAGKKQAVLGYLSLLETRDIIFNLKYTKKV